MTTIKDVAASAGVGVATVSRVLNDHPAVTPDTRDRVRAAIASLDYRPSRVARALSQQRSGTIAVVVPFFTVPSVVERLRGVIDALHNSPYAILLFDVSHPDHRRADVARMLRRDLVEGLLVLSLRLTPDEVRRLGENRVRAVAIDADVPGLPSISIDDTKGGRLAARHLLELGHQRIGYIGDQVDQRFGFTSSARRLRGLSHELAAAGHPLDPSLVRHGPHEREAARALARDLLTCPDRPTAVFAHSDTQALGVLEAAADVGLRVPADCSVMGFDDVEAARYAGLTTVRQPLFESGRQGAAALLTLLEGGGGLRSTRTELALEVVPRRTTRRLAADRSALGVRRRRSA
jgi:LacI family transcriptional regulator